MKFSIPHARFSIATLVYLTLMEIHQGSNAQGYLPLAIENATWIVNFSDNDFTYDDYYAYKIQGDSLHEGRLYKKVYYWELTDNISQPYQIESNYLLGLLRDDTISGKVYVIMLSSLLWMDHCLTDALSEALLYDFAIHTGDTVRDCRTEGALTESVVDTIYSDTLFGNIRRVWSLWEDFSLIEGIGFSRGLFTEANLVISAAWGIWLEDYCIGTNFECGLHTAVTEILESEVEVFPNPTKDVLQLKSDSYFTSAWIANPTVQYVAQVPLSASQTIDVSQLPSGMYFLQVFGRAGNFSAKFVKR